MTSKFVSFSLNLLKNTKDLFYGSQQKVYHLNQLFFSQEVKEYKSQAISSVRFHVDEKNLNIALRFKTILKIILDIPIPSLTRIVYTKNLLTPPISLFCSGDEILIAI